MQTEKLLGKSTCESRQSFQKQNCEENASNEDYDNRLIKKKARAKKTVDTAVLHLTTYTSFHIRLRKSHCLIQPFEGYESC